MIYTFYSFKGGVGRSMALANVAEMLYRRGLDVLMIDFDLEAPGLERYFSETLSAQWADRAASKRGIIDLLNSYKELRSLPRTQSPPAAKFAEGEDDAFPYPVEPLTNFVVPVYERGAAGGGSLSLITAGRRAGKEFTRYAQQVRAFDWNDFHIRWDGERFFDWFRREAEKVAPVVLVDSRTGVTEMGGVCIYHLADVVVMFVATNQQNVGGTSSIARSLSNEKLISQARKGRPISAVFVPSRVESNEKMLLDRFAESFNEIFGGLTAPALDDGRNLFNEFKVPYVPYFSFMESVAAREPESAGAQPLVSAFENIIRAVARVEPEGGPLRDSYFPSEGKRPKPKSANIFISYKRGREPEDAVAGALTGALAREGHHVFTAEAIQVGESWPKRIEGELHIADYFITLLSETSVESEMMSYELEKAQQLSRAKGGRPAIIPVRLNYTEPLPYPLSLYLDRIKHALWAGPHDTARLVKELTEVVASGELAAARQSHLEDSAGTPPRGETLPAPVTLEAPGGAVTPDSPFYLEREVDRIALAAVGRKGATLIIKGPRQVGKSSLLGRVLNSAVRAGQSTAFLDFQLFAVPRASDPASFFLEFCAWLTDVLGLEDRVEEFWNTKLGNSQLCTRYLERYVLPSVASPLVLAMDEADRILTADYANDFFSMLRSWHDSRSHKTVWQQLSLVLVISTEPYMLIDSPIQSPINVGTVIEPSDFRPDEVAELNRRHGSPLTSREVRQLVELTGGQPYLTRQALYLVAATKMSFTELLEGAADERGPFGDHLRRHLFRLHDRPKLLEALREVFKHGECSDERALYALVGMGLVLRQGRSVSLRCGLYKEYFRQWLA